MAKIARDETRHAALAHEVDAWLRPKLDRAARRRVECARNDALDQLRRELAICRADATLGTPDGAAAVAFADRLFAFQ